MSHRIQPHFPQPPYWALAHHRPHAPNPVPTITHLKQNQPPMSLTIIPASACASVVAHHVLRRGRLRAPPLNRRQSSLRSVCPRPPLRGGRL